MLNDRVAIVTGGAVGIGKEISLKLAKDGAKIVVNYRKSEEEAKALVEEIKSFGGHALAVKADIGGFLEAKHLVDEAIRAFGGIDIVVNNAGITDDALLLRMQEEQFDRVINTNLKGVFNVCKHASRSLLKSKAGRIINISSVAGIKGNVGQANYAASKAGLIGFTKTLAREFASKGITANVVAPGFIETKMTDLLSTEIKEMALNEIPLKRFGSSSDVAMLVSFLASDNASYITGQVISVDGGLSI
ncbi:MAG: 3-oxoacyl-[acyl-carrier-protein] reductase [Acholeplasma sp.]|nr:3-oxoacyl-[acyl-carrier-protein] reductase [Acholeplasma sp.]